MNAIQIEARVIGRRKPVVRPWQLPIPDAWRTGEKALCLRDLIVLAVTHEVAAFNQRQEQNQFLNVLTNRQTADQAKSGSIRFGDRDPQKADKDKAIEVALEAFEDGLYYVFLDGVQIADLGERITLSPDSQVTFVRLVALAGG